MLPGSALLFYIVVYAGTAHACGFMAVSGMLYAALVLAGQVGSERTGRWWCLLGFMGALAVVIRFSNGLFLMAALWPVLGVWRRLPQQPVLRRWLYKGLVTAFLGGLPVILAQFVYWRSFYGCWFPSTHDAFSIHWLQPALAGYLFSHQHGLFFFSPVSLLALAGLVATFFWPGRLGRPVSAILLAATGLLLYLNASWGQWWFGDGFGTRSFLEASPAVFIGMAWLYARFQLKGQLVCLALALMSVTWTLLLMFAQLFNYIAHDGSTPTREVLHALGRLLMR